MKTYHLMVRAVVRAESPQIARNSVKLVQDGAGQIVEWYVEDAEDIENGE